MCAAKGCTEPAVPNPPGKGRPTKYCLKHQLHKDRTRKRLKKDGVLSAPKQVDEDTARQLAVWLGMTNDNVESAVALAKLRASGAELEALVERARSPDLKGLRDRTPAALGELFAGTVAIATLRAQAALGTMEPGEVLAT